MKPNKKSAEDEAPRTQSLLEKNNGNYVAALVAYIDRLPAPTWLRATLKAAALGLIIATVICMLVWPFVVRLVN